LNPTLLVKILRVFANPTAKNPHLPPRSVPAGHIHVGVVGASQGTLPDEPSGFAGEA
jgi:hypothetical protein